MPRGGKREGAGRKEGTTNTKTREIAEKAIATGLTPLEVLLDNMLFFHRGAGEALERLLKGEMPTPDEVIEGSSAGDVVEKSIVQGIKQVLGLRKAAGEAAVQAAPYIHVRLAPSQDKGTNPQDDEVPLVDRLKRYATAEAIEASGGKVVKLDPPRPAPSGKSKAKASKAK